MSEARAIFSTAQRLFVYLDWYSRYRSPRMDRERSGGATTGIYNVSYSAGNDRANHPKKTWWNYHRIVILVSAVATLGGCTTIAVEMMR